MLGRLPSLETAERISWLGVSAGFALLTFGILSGLCQVFRDADAIGWLTDPKIILTFVVWLGYLVVLLVRLAPRFRGRPAAELTIVSFVLLVCAFVVADLLVVKHP